MKLYNVILYYYKNNKLVQDILIDKYINLADTYSLQNINNVNLSMITAGVE